MDGETDREAMVRHLMREIARCKYAIENITDRKTLERLGDYQRDLERALEGQVSRAASARPWGGSSGKDVALLKQRGGKHQPFCIGGTKWE